MRTPNCWVAGLHGTWLGEEVYDKVAAFHSQLAYFCVLEDWSVPYQGVTGVGRGLATLRRSESETSS